MAEKQNKEPTETDSKLEWFGMQLIQRTRGVLEPTARSFPFWGPSADWAIGEAKKLNRANQQSRNPVRWTHVVIHTHIVETQTGTETRPLEIKEVRV